MSEIMRNYEENAQTKREAESAAGQAARAEAAETAEAASEKPFGIEESFARLDGILEQLEAEGCPLETSFQLYEEGMKLIASAEAQIEKAEEKLRILNGEEDEDEIVFF